MSQMKKVRRPDPDMEQVRQTNQVQSEDEGHPQNQTP